MIREDYVLRLVRQFAQALARLIGKRTAGDLDGARAAADRIYDDLFTMPRELTDRLDTPTLAQLLGRADDIRAAAMLFWEEGHLFQVQGDPLGAGQRYRRAHELVLEARALEPHPDDDAALLELARVAPARELDPRYRGEL